MRFGRGLGWSLAVAALVGGDQGTKQVAKQRLEGAEPHVLVRSILELRYAENRDVGFNLLRFIPAEVRRPLILLLATGSVVALVVWATLEARKARAALRPKSWLGWELPLALFVAGALGNILDRAFRGYVIDFIHLSHWPVFNAADIYVTVGAGLFAVGALAARAKGDGQRVS